MRNGFACAIMILLSLVAGLLNAQEWREEPHHPRYFAGKINDIGVYGHEWVAASAVLTSDGRVKHTGVHPALREGLEWQLHNSRADHGLDDGEFASERWCAQPEGSAGSYLPLEQDGRFISALLLAEVAVTATLSDGIPGFFSSGNPGVLFALSDVSPLHAQSAVPAYVLVPADRLVIQGRVFCAVKPPTHIRFNPANGNQVVILGELGDHGTVRVGRWWDRIGHWALVEDQEMLRWDHFAEYTTPPLSLSQLYRRVDDAVTGGLFNVTSHLMLQKHGSVERKEFVEKLGSHESSGCRVLDVTTGTLGQGWRPTLIACSAGEE